MSTTTKDNYDSLKYLSLSKLEEIKTDNYTSYNRSTKVQHEYCPETIDQLIMDKEQHAIELELEEQERAYYTREKQLNDAGVPEILHISPALTTIKGSK